MLSFHGLKGCAVSSYTIDRLESSQMLLQNNFFFFFFLNIVYRVLVYICIITLNYRIKLNIYLAPEHIEITCILFTIIVD